MKFRLLIGTIAAFGIAGAVQAAETEMIDDSSLGLSKASVFDDTLPEVWSFSDLDPDDVDALPRAWEGAPPQVPHEMRSMLPLGSMGNECLECHDKPKYIGRENNEGRRSPMAKDHYVNTDDPDPKKWKLDGRHYNCVQCHVEQADVKPLVENTFVGDE